jgi:sRNA-binding protein
MTDTPALNAGALVESSNAGENRHPLNIAPATPAQACRQPELLALLIELFPACFTMTGRRPLKIGVHRDIIDRVDEIDRRQLNRAFGWYCGSIHYLKATVEGTERVDLDGNSAGLITAEEAAYAKATLAGLNNKINEKVWARVLAKRRAHRAERDAKAWAEYHERKEQWRAQKAAEVAARTVAEPTAAPPKRLGTAAPTGGAMSSMPSPRVRYLARRIHALGEYPLAHLLHELQNGADVSSANDTPRCRPISSASTAATRSRTAFDL